MRALAALALVVACSRPAPRRPGDEYLKAIEVEGNRALPAGQLVAGLALRRTQRNGGPPDPYLVQVDAERIRGEYLRAGFLSIDVRARVERSGDGATVVYTVEEGPRAATKVEITGVPDRELAARIRATLPLADGEPFDYARYERAKPALLVVAQDASYAHARLETTIYADRATDTALVQLAYDLGPASRFGDVSITGAAGPLADAIRRRLQLAPGEPYSARAIAATQRAIYALARFSSVEVEPDTTGEPVVGVRVAVTEATRHEAKLGGGFGIDPTTYEVRLRAGYSVAGWPFPLDTTTIDLRPAYGYLRDTSGYAPRLRALARLERQDFLWTYARGQVEGGYRYVAIEAYSSYGPHARLSFQTQLGSPRYLLRAGWGFEYLQFRDIAWLIPPGLQAELGLDRAQRLGAFTQALVFDWRDSPLEPTRGAYAELRVTEGTRYAGGAFGYVQLVPDVRGYVPFGRVVVAARARTGLIFGDVPVTERMFSGGASSHRGFGQRHLSPTVTGIEADGEARRIPYGGAALVETSLEARVAITTWRSIGIGAAAFVDGGDCTETPSELDLGRLHWAVGLGVRLQTLVGPIRVDVGYRVNRTGPGEPEPDSRVAFHFSLGEAF